MTDEQPVETPTFPQYHPPGIPVADPKFHKPLYKMLKMMMKPKLKRMSKVSKVSHRHKKHKRVLFH